MLEIFEKIKLAYRESFKKYQKIFRNGRRKLQRNSEEYANFVYDSYANLSKIFNDSINEVLKEMQIPREIYDNSWRVLKNDEIILESAEDMRVVSNLGHFRKDLPIEIIQDSLKLCKERFESEYSNNERLQLVISLLEDELKEAYGIEIEDLEKAYFAFADNFEDYDWLFNAIKDSKTVIDI